MPAATETAADTDLTAQAREIAAEDIAFAIELEIERAGRDAYDATYEATDGSVVEAMHAAMWARIEAAEASRGR